MMTELQSIDYEKLIKNLKEAILKKDDPDFNIQDEISKLLFEHICAPNITEFIKLHHEIHEILKDLGCDLSEIWNNQEYVDKLNRLLKVDK